MSLLTQYERTYSTPPEPPDPPTPAETENRPYHVGIADRREGVPKSENPFVTTANRELWEMGWDYEDMNQKELLK